MSNFLCGCLHHDVGEGEAGQGVRKGLWLKPGAGTCGLVVLETSLQADASGTPTPPHHVLGPHSQVGLLTTLPPAPRPPVLSA